MMAAKIGWKVQLLDVTKEYPELRLYSPIGFLEFFKISLDKCSSSGKHIDQRNLTLISEYLKALFNVKIAKINKTIPLLDWQYVDKCCHGEWDDVMAISSEEGSTMFELNQLLCEMYKSLDLPLIVLQTLSHRLGLLMHDCLNFIENRTMVTFYLVKHIVIDLKLVLFFCTNPRKLSTIGRVDRFCRVIRNDIDLRFIYETINFFFYHDYAKKTCFFQDSFDHHVVDYLIPGTHYFINDSYLRKFYKTESLCPEN